MADKHWDSCRRNEICGIHHFANVRKLCKSFVSMTRRRSKSSSSPKLDAGKKLHNSIDFKDSKVSNQAENQFDYCTPRGFSRNLSNPIGYSVSLPYRPSSYSQPLGPTATNNTSSTKPSISKSGSQSNMNQKSLDGIGGQWRSFSRSVSTRIMYSNSTGVIKSPAVEYTLACTLEDICFGCIKKIKITRDVVIDYGEIIQKDEVLTINVKPGWRSGTKITFEGMGNEVPGGERGDITFVIAEKKHPFYKKDGDDLVFEIEIPLVKALVGCKLWVPLLNRENMSLTIEDVVYPGYCKVVAGQGMPKAKDEGERGNLIVKFQVEFPKQLTDEQRSDVYNTLHNYC